MAHRTLNPVTAFGWDAREDKDTARTAPKNQKHHVHAAWSQEFPEERMPHYWGCLPREVYPRLQAAGWKFSAKYGWRKPDNANHTDSKPTKVILCSACQSELAGGTDTFGDIHVPLCQSCWLSFSFNNEKALNR